MWLILGHHYKPFRRLFWVFIFWRTWRSRPQMSFIYFTQIGYCQKKTTSDFDYIFDKIPQVHRMCYSVWFKSNFPLAPHYSNDGVDVLFYFILHVKRVFYFVFLNTPEIIACRWWSTSDICCDNIGVREWMSRKPGWLHW